MLFKYNYYELLAHNDGSEDPEVQDKKEFVPGFIAVSTLELADQVEMERDNTVNNKIMRVVTHGSRIPRE